jgi:hypothetical protein
VSLVAVGASADVGRPRQIRGVRDRNIAAAVVAGLVRNWLGDAGSPHSQLLKSLWIELKRYGALRVGNIEISRIRGIDHVRVDGPVRRHSPLIVAALAMLLESETIFQIGPDRSDTAPLLAHNLPGARLFVLDETAAFPDQSNPGTTDRLYRLPLGPYGGPDPAGRTSRVTHLSGDSFTFDFVPYSGKVDLLYIEGSRRYSHIGSDTEAAFGLLSDLGTIVWDGYAGDAGVYAYVNEIASSLDRPVFHILGTRLALYSRWDIVVDAE